MTHSTTSHQSRVIFEPPCQPHNCHATKNKPHKPHTTKPNRPIPRPAPPHPHPPQVVGCPVGAAASYVTLPPPPPPTQVVGCPVGTAALRDLASAHKARSRCSRSGEGGVQGRQSSDCGAAPSAAAAAGVMISSRQLCAAQVCSRPTGSSSHTLALATGPQAVAVTLWSDVVPVQPLNHPTTPCIACLACLACLATQLPNPLCSLFGRIQSVPDPPTT